MEKYEINKETLAVVGIDGKTTKIFEKNREYIINDIAYEVMEHSCKYFGSSYGGRVEGSKRMIDSNYKLPVIVEESNELIFFPITTIENPKNIWVSLKGFDKVLEEKGKTYIYLKNGKKVVTSVSKNSIENQVLRSTRLLYVLNERKMAKNR